MKHLIFTRLGNEDVNAPTAEAGTLVSTINFVDEGRRLQHGIGKVLNDLNGLGIYPSENSLDLFLLAATVYLADTRVKRSKNSQDGWTREISLSLPVSSPVAWAREAATLHEMLSFLTGDIWTVSFRPRAAGSESLVSDLPLQGLEPAYDSVSLFSGGMDSLIGAIDELADGGTPLFVSHAGESATSSAQNKCIPTLRAAFPGSGFGWLRAWLQFDHAQVVGGESDDTTRSRSFLFIAAAAFAASGLHRPVRLRIPENGFIALNVPLEATRVGSLSTRTAHPYYLTLWNRLLAGLEISAETSNPYALRTKGEMVAGCRNADLLRRMLPDSMSCSSPLKARWRGHGIQHCGYCLPCLIRRASLAGYEDPTTYTEHDLGAAALSTRRAVGTQVRSFQVAATRLASEPHLARFLVLKPGPLPDGRDERLAFAGVYSRGMAEIGAFLEGVRTVPE